MRQKLLLPLLAFLLLGLWLAPGSALASKLDARARIAAEQLRSGMSPQQLRASRAAVSPTGMLDVFIRGDFAAQDLEALGVVIRTQLPGLCTAYVPVDALPVLEADPRVTSIRGSVQAEQTLNASIPTTGANLLRGAGPTFTGVNGAGVLVGDVDSGIDIHHGDFKDAGGLSRILYLWDQTVTGTPPSGFAIGTEWTKAQIDGGTCTEKDTDGHGTHVMGIAAGDGSQTGSLTPAYTYTGMAPMADIAMVKTTFSTTDILDGVNYIFQRATALGKLASVNLSLGSEFGPHDGTSDFESGLGALTGPGRIISVAAGNDRGTNWHAGFTVPVGGDSAKFTVTSTTNMPLGNPTAAIDGYYNLPDNMSITLRSPTNAFVGPITMGNINAAYPGTLLTGSANVYIENGAFVTSTGAREVYIEVTRTSSTHPVAGTWTIYFTPVSAPNGRVDMWKFYSGAGTTVFSLKNANDHLVAEPGNAPAVISVAAFATKASWTDCGDVGRIYSSPPTIGAIASFSGIGPTRDGRQKPDLAAPGFGVASTRSFDVSLTCGGTTGNAPFLVNDGGNHIINQGTSMAAPHVTGAVAMLLQKYGAWTPAQMLTYLNAHATIDGFTGAPWNSSFGNGKLNLGDLVDPQVAVLFPNGGENLLIGGGTILQWTATDNVGVTSVDLYLSRAGAAGPWETIALGVPNTGSYGWNATGPATANALLKVVAHDANGNTGTDASDAVWTLFDGPTPTLVALVDATADAEGVRLSWSVASASPVHLYRSTGTGTWQLLATLTPGGDGRVNFNDASVTAGARYGYRLGVSSGGREVVAGETWVAVPVRAVFALQGGRPNPSTGPLAISFSLTDASSARLELVDLNGRRVVDREVGSLGAGFHVLPVDGGARLPVGIYMVRLSQHGNVLKSKVAIVR